MHFLPTHPPHTPTPPVHPAVSLRPASLLPSFLLLSSLLPSLLPSLLLSLLPSLLSSWPKLTCTLMLSPSANTAFSPTSSSLDLDLALALDSLDLDFPGLDSCLASLDLDLRLDSLAPSALFLVLDRDLLLLSLACLWALELRPSCSSRRPLAASPFLPDSFPLLFGLFLSADLDLELEYLRFFLFLDLLRDLILFLIFSATGRLFFFTSILLDFLAKPFSLFSFLSLVFFFFEGDLDLEEDELEDEGELEELEEL